MTATFDASEILNRMAERYAALETYVDTTIMSRMMRSENGLYEMISHSAISFSRSSGFRFHFKKHFPRSRDWSHGVVVRANGTTKSWWMGASKEDDATTLSHALAGFAGVSLGASWLVPRLLLPDESESLSPTGLLDLRALGIADVGGRGCVHVVGRHPLTAVRHAFWIDRETLLIRRWYVSPVTENGLSGMTTEIAPSTDVTLDATAFDTETPQYERLP